MRGDRSGSVPLLGSIGALIAVACCAGLPLVGAILGGLTVAAVIGLAAGLLVVAATFAGAVLVVRTRRRDCAQSGRQVRGDG